MKIRNPLINYYSCKRHVRNANLAWSKSKIVEFLELDLLQLYIYSKYWYSVHTVDETRDEHFYCLICKEPDYFIEMFNIFLVTRAYALNPITYILKISKWKIHFRHKYFLWIKDHNSCPVCFYRYLKNTSINERKKRRYSDLMPPNVSYDFWHK